MLERSAIFAVSLILGLLIQGFFVHALLPSVAAPDLVLILVFFVALEHRNPAGLVGAFFLGIAADSASGQFLGPQAAGFVVAFLVILFCAERIYAERGFAVAVVTFFASISKSVVYALFLLVYSNAPIFSLYVLKLILAEATLTAICAPFVLWILFRIGRRGSYRGAVKSGV